MIVERWYDKVKLFYVLKTEEEQSLDKLFINISSCSLYDWKKALIDERFVNWFPNNMVNTNEYLYWALIKSKSNVLDELSNPDSCENLPKEIQEAIELAVEYHASIS